MSKLRELIDALADEKVQARTHLARQNRTCKICQNPVGSFEMPISENEYRLSTICESCQRYFCVYSD